MKKIVQIENLYLRRSATFRLKVASCTALPGTITCITGPNGGGKSTLIEAIVGLLQPDIGTVLIDGHNLRQKLREARAKIGYVPDDEEWFIKELCAREYFALLADIYSRAGVTGNLAKAWQSLAEYLCFTNLDVPIQELSHGNKKKVQIIAALMHDPPLIIVDEIRNGLDPIAIASTEKLLKDRAHNGVCIIAATHDLWWAERIADSVLILAGGNVLVQSAVTDIRQQHGSLETLFMKLVAT